jgi:dTDP-glucose 4,6-dehydratase
VITNCSNNFGAHQHAEKLIPTIIRKAMANEPIPIYGNGKNVRDWLFVKDHCKALDSVFHHAAPGEHYNIGGNNERANIDIARMICNLLDKDENLIQYVTDRAGHDFRYAVSTDKIQRDLGWQPTTAFEAGLENTIQFYKKDFQD